MDEKVFERLAEQTLVSLQKSLDTVDSLEVELSQGVLTVAFESGAPAIINSHRAATQIWMAADRQAWHFEPTNTFGESGDAAVRWVATKAPHEELWDAVEAVLSRRLGRTVKLR